MGSYIEKKINDIPTKISSEAKSALMSYLSEKNETGVYANSFVGFHLDLTLEYLFRLTKNPDAEKPKANQSCMSKECQAWCGFDTHDPYVPFVRMERGIFAGRLHTLDTLGSKISDNRKDHIRENLLSHLDKIEAY